MLLAIDIGNSSVKLGVFDGEKLITRRIIPTIRSNTAGDLYASIQDEIKGPLSAIVVSSVVPELDDAFRVLCETYFNKTPFFVASSFDTGLEIKYFPPENLGVDRLIAAFAAAEKYGAPVIVCDFGTATTIDAVNSKKEFLGGVITPGMNTLGEALFIKTSRLPRIALRKPETVIGNSTVHAIESGIFYGYIGLTEGILNRMISELGVQPKVVATGGFASLIAANCDLIETVDESLMLDGLRLIGERTNKDLERISV